MTHEPRAATVELLSAWPRNLFNGVFLETYEHAGK
jgi:hypothetical protein